MLFGIVWVVWFFVFVFVFTLIFNHFLFKSEKFKILSDLRSLNTFVHTKFLLLLLLLIIIITWNLKLVNRIDTIKKTILL